MHPAQAMPSATFRNRQSSICIRQWLSEAFAQALRERRPFPRLLVLEVHERVLPLRPGARGWCRPSGRCRRLRSLRPASGSSRSRRSRRPAWTASRCRRCTARDCARAGARRRASSNHDGWRNSNAALAPGGRSARNASKTARSILKFGASWNSSTPSLSPSVPAAWQNARSKSPASRRRLSCVMRLGALSVSLYGDGRAGCPAGDELLGGQPVERVVDLDRRETAPNRTPASSTPADQPDRRCPSTRGSCSRKCRSRSLRLMIAD